MFKYTWKHQGKNKGDNYNKPFIYISYRFNTNSLRFLYKRIKRNQGGITKNKSDFYKRLHLSQVRALPQKYPPAQFTKKKRRLHSLGLIHLSIGKSQVRQLLWVGKVICERVPVIGPYDWIYYLQNCYWYPCPQDYDK
jgi:hypothetical protein